MIDETTTVVVQGITGRHGTFHTGQMLAYGTRIAAGTSPGKGGRVHLGVPVFDTVREAVETTGASASVIFVLPASAKVICGGYPKPVFAYVAGVTAPSETRMGHAGAFISSGMGDAKSKIQALREAGAVIIDSPAEIGVTVAQKIKEMEHG
jgi:succinyl-CoA synthetase alpha subunit